MRRLATTSSALGFLWACAATVHLLVIASPAGIARSATLAAGGMEPSGMPPLATAEGVWMAGLLMGVALLAGVPLGVALTHPSGQRVTALAVGLLILGFCALTGFFVGLLYLPSAVLVLLAAAAARVQPEVAPYADLHV